MRKRKFEEDYEDDYVEWMDRHLASLKEWEFVNLKVGARDGVWTGDDVRELLVSSWENYAAGAIDYAPDDMMDRLDTDGLGLRKAQEVVWVAPPRKFPFEKVGAAYGNEPSVENYYASACLIAWVPPSSERMSTEKET
ncbi:hypothetical protein Poli38472_011584 [Pythium oligandrum]|uniref:Uncharacterized protein n=1 Tax=Pythium oligandrum TaxID=41045 RepID=A0A8K1CJG5_PYTOL|nr:hypothetical protein Poli38472_011584 [Pythium oligandrum]|eukprot:TMW64704.1 hypothetical protein Poli38472_011584 [Pythium oligandrum]